MAKMRWRNIGLIRIKRATPETFTTRFGIRVRRWINPVFRRVVRCAIKHRVFVEAYPALEQGVPYIFAATHSFVEDLITDIAYLDRSAYILIGTTDQVDHNLQMYATWVNGVIYVDKRNTKSRKDSLDKMERVLRAGTSVLLYPEGSWNNTENLLCLPLFAGAHILAQRTACRVVPVACFHEHNSNDIHIEYGAPIDMAAKTKRAGLTELRDALASMMYRMMEKYGTPLIRADLPADPRLAFMEERKREYRRATWTRDVWDEEITCYYDRMLPPTPQQVRASFDHVRLTPQNAGMLAPIFLERERDRKYDFVAYMHENWDA